MIENSISEVRQVPFFELFPDEELLTGLLDACDYDYPTICKMAATCKTLRDAVYSKFIEIRVWQIRCNQIPYFTKSINDYEVEIEALKKEIGCDSNPPLPILINFNPNLSDILAVKIKYLWSAESDKNRITNMCNEFRTLFYPGNPIVALFGGYLNLLELPEVSNASDMDYKTLSIVMKIECMFKSFNNNGPLSFLIADQNISILELKISSWVNSLICQVEGNGYTATRTCNDVEGFSDGIDWSKERTVSSKTKKQPLWTVTQIFQNQQRITSNFALGQKYDPEKFQYLREAISRNYREIKARELEEDNL